MGGKQAGKAKDRRKLPRAPLPRQKGGPHETRAKRPWRRRKHKADAPGDGGDAA